ncbi:hypothetical protein O6H91_06G036000 [Diphasiastrum complanatum]|nr:hypothetical protein O6H91_06G036000 [Diphasiastrum complanatum]
MSTSGKLYVAQKAKGKFQHSSFLAGSATTAAGRLLVNKGVLELMEAHSGHYHPTEENFNMLVNILIKNGADLTMAKVQSVSDDMLPSHLYSQQSFLKETEDLKSAEALDNFVQDDKVLVAAEDEKAVKQREDVLSSKRSETQLADSDNFAAKEAARLDIIYNKDSLEGVSIEVKSTKGCNDDPCPKGNEVRIGDESFEKSFKDEVLSDVHVAEEPVAPEKNETPNDSPITTVQMGVKKLPSFSWSSGVGARLSTLSDLPVHVRSKAVEFLRQPSQRMQFTAAN